LQRLFLVSPMNFVRLVVLRLKELRTDRSQDSVSDISWYGSAYMMACCAVQLLYGRVYKFWPAKYVFIVAIFLFEVGSAVCGVAPNSSTLIVGRAISGAGAAGILSGTMQILVHTVPLEKRPLYTGLFAVIGSASSVLGPVLGGVFTEHVSWRWCFYINLPFGALSIVVVVFLLKEYNPPEHGLSWREKINRLDVIGTSIFIPAVTCLILALEWGGVTYAWNNWRIVLTLVLFGVLFLVWSVIQHRKQDRATVPPRVFFQRNMVAAFAYAAAGSGTLMFLFYYLSVYFQAVKGVSPVTAGLSLLPMILSLIAAAVLSGLCTRKIGYYWPTMCAAPVVASVGIGMLTTLRPDTNHPKWIGYQVLAGFGMGLSLQQSSLIAQTVLSRADIPVGISLVFFGQQLGAAIFLAIGQTIFNGQLRANLESVAGVSSADIIDAGAANLQASVPQSLLSAVVAAYNDAITTAMYLSLALMCFMLVPALYAERRSIKAKDQGRQVEEKAAEG
jgi:MFS family permease